MITLLSSRLVVMSRNRAGCVTCTTELRIAWHSCEAHAQWKLISESLRVGVRKSGLNIHIHKSVFT